jgi:hypothetical protein
VRQHIGVAPAVETFVEGYLDAADYQLSALDQGVAIEANADSNLTSPASFSIRPEPEPGPLRLLS